MEKVQEFFNFDNIQPFLRDNPVIYGIVFFLLGLFLFLGAVFDWNWIFGNISKTNYDSRKIDGLTNLFGRKTARFLFGALCLLIMLSGLIAVWLNLKQ